MLLNEDLVASDGRTAVVWNKPVNRDSVLRLVEESGRRSWLSRLLSSQNLNYVGIQSKPFGVLRSHFVLVCLTLSLAIEGVQRGRNWNLNGEVRPYRIFQAI